MFGLSIPLDLQASKLSVGQLHRLGLSMVLLSRPKILLLDEPTSHVDQYAATKVADGLVNSTDTGLSKESIIVVATHDQHFAQKGESVVLDRGKAYSKTMDELFLQHVQQRKLFKRAEKQAREADAESSSDDVIEGMLDTKCLIKEKTLTFPAVIASLLSWSTADQFILFDRGDSLMLLDQSSVHAKDLKSSGSVKNSYTSTIASTISEKFEITFQKSLRKYAAGTGNRALVHVGKRYIIIELGD